jgi:hypothetical protein
MAEVRFIEHKGRRILLMDFSYTKVEEIFGAIESAKKTVKKYPERSVYGLVDVRFSTFDAELFGALKDLAGSDRPYMKVTAVVGVTGLKKLIFMAVQRFTGRKNMYMFDRLETAKDWLVEQ